MGKEVNIVQLYSDGTEAYPVTNEHLVHDDNGNEIISILRNEVENLKTRLAEIDSLYMDTIIDKPP